MIAPESKPNAEPVTAAWPERLVVLGAQWDGAAGPRQKDAVATEIWCLAHAALFRYLRVHARQLGVRWSEDFSDIAADKALDLWRRLDEGRWGLSGSNPAQVTAFISTLARNGLVDHLRSSKTSRRVSLEDGWEGVRSIQAVARTAPSADLDAERREFAGALRDCVMQLTPRARLVWFLRVFHELPSVTIGAHPEVRMKPPTIDVTLARCRARLVRCMQKRGFVPHDAPPGVFAFLWEVVRLRSEDDA